jgi:hypothetical protein
VYVNPDTPYDRTRLARRQKLPLAPGVDAYFARAEDVILYKLLYAREGGSFTCATSSGSSVCPDLSWTSDTSPSGPTDWDWEPSGSRFAGRRAELPVGVLPCYILFRIGDSDLPDTVWPMGAGG